MEPRVEWLEVDYYAVLGVDSSATAAEINKAYKAMAKRHHPDTNPEPNAAETFKSISAAYQVIGDEQNRTAYDDYRRYGRRSSELGASGLEDLFSDADLRHSGFPFGFTRGWNSPPRPGPDVEFGVKVSFKEAVEGCERTLSYHLVGDAQPRRITVRIPAGVDDDQRVRVPGGGGEGLAGGPRGDLYVIVGVEPHATFIRRNDDLYVTVPVSFQEAVLGAEIEVPTLRGPVTIKIPPYTANGKKFRVKGRGVRGGHLYVTVELRIPSELSAEDLIAIEELDDDAATLARQDLVARSSDESPF